MDLKKSDYIDNELEAATGASAQKKVRKRNPQRLSKKPEVHVVPDGDVVATDNPNLTVAKPPLLTSNRSLLKKKARPAPLVYGAPISDPKLLSPAVKAMNQARLKLYAPNHTNREWNACIPLSVVVGDFREFDNIGRPGDQLGHSRLLVFMDLASGKIVGHLFDKSITAERVAQVIDSILSATPSHLEGQTILHTDRGCEFASKAVRGLRKKFPRITLSMSRMATPLDNCVIESFFRASDQLKDSIWTLAGFPNGQPQTFDSIEQGALTWARFFEAYNANHKNSRNMFVTPNVAFDALSYAIAKGTPTLPLFTLANNVPTTLEQASLNQALLAYKYEAASQFLLARLEVDKNLSSPLSKEILSLDAALKLASLGLQATKIASDEIREEVRAGNDMLETKLNAKLDAAVNVILEAIKPPKTESKRASGLVKKRPMIIRSALSSKTVFELYKGADGSSPVRIRSILAVLLSRSMGSRLNEINRFTFKQVKDLAKTRFCNLHNTKCNVMEEKAITGFFAKQIDSVADMLMVSLKASFNVDEIPLSTFVFSSYKSLDSQPLSSSAFLRSVNHMMSEFAQDFNEKSHGPKLRLTSHSCRVGYVTELIQNGATVEQVRKLVGHKDTRSTIRYDRSILSAEDRIEMLEQFSPVVDFEEGGSVEET